jgi:hypothetical protein
MKPVETTGRSSVDPDLERSRPSSPVHDHDRNGGIEVEALQSITDPYMNRYRFLAVCLMNFANGLNDSAPGALIPSMEK